MGWDDRFMKEYKCLHCGNTVEAATLPQDWAYCAGNRFICRECVTNCRVSDLGNFPFDNFQHFQEAYKGGIVRVGVDMGTAREWLRIGRYAPKTTGYRLLYWCPYLAILGFILYSAVTRSWLLLLALPLFVGAFFIFNPGARFFGVFRTALIILVHLGFVYSIIRYNPNWLAITLVLMVMFYAQQAMYRIASDSLVKAILKHEDLLCVLWLKRSMNVIYKDEFFIEPLSGI